MKRVSLAHSLKTTSGYNPLCPTASRSYSSAGYLAPMSRPTFFRSHDRLSANIPHPTFFMLRCAPPRMSTRLDTQGNSRIGRATLSAPGRLEQAIRSPRQRVLAESGLQAGVLRSEQLLPRRRDSHAILNNNQILSFGQMGCIAPGSPAGHGNAIAWPRSSSRSSGKGQLRLAARASFRYL